VSPSGATGAGAQPPKDRDGLRPSHFPDRPAAAIGGAPEAGRCSYYTGRAREAIEVTTTPAATTTEPKAATLGGALQGCALGALAGFIARDLDLPALISFEHSREPLVIVAALVGAALGATRFRRWLGAVVAALALLWGAVAFSPISGWLADGLARRELEEPADVVFVSFAGLAPGAQRMTEAYNRALHGAELLARGKVKVVAVPESSSLPSVAVVRDLMGRLGLPGEPVVVGRADTTHEEAVAVGAAARKEGWKLLLVVSSPIHSRRICAALEKEGVTVVSTPSLESRFNIDDLSTPADRLAAFGSVMHERLGFWVYARRGWVSTGLSQ
jgi:uncharacterized SAM-binding protein YcdF (DUF218 family)